MPEFRLKAVHIVHVEDRCLQGFYQKKMKSQVKSCYILKWAVFLRNNYDYSEGIIALKALLLLTFLWGRFKGGLAYPGSAGFGEFGHFGAFEEKRSAGQVLRVVVPAVPFVPQLPGSLAGNSELAGNIGQGPIFRFGHGFWSLFSLSRPARISSARSMKRSSLSPLSA